jgi:hypothetical protein
MNKYLSNAKSVMSMVIFLSTVPSPPLKPRLKNMNNGNNLKGKNNNATVKTLKPPPRHPYLIHPKTQNLPI